MNFEDVRLIDLLTRVEAQTKSIMESKNLSQVKELGRGIQAVYDFFVTSQKAYEEQQPMLKNLFSSFNYAAVIINDAMQKKQLDGEAQSLLSECFEIIIACCANVKNSL